MGGGGGGGGRGGRGGPGGARGYLSNGYFGVILTICFGWRRGYFGVRVWARHEFGVLSEGDGAPAVACPGSSQIGLVCRPVIDTDLAEKDQTRSIKCQ